jgi:exopolyphosphatase/guanosine-5'-triphosphate,3'-diphosphate pyrophosphatase
MSAREGTAVEGTVRVAGIDMGSNSTRMLIADVTRSGDTVSLERIGEQVEITKLGEQVDTRGILLPQAIARTRNALATFRKELRDAGAVFVYATATSAVRDSDNGEAFLGEVEYSYGFRTEMLAGGDEAALSFSGAQSDAALAERVAKGTSLLVDIGGGSTEIVLATDGEITDFHSFQIGCVRMTERFLDGSDLPPPDGVVRAYQEIAAELAERFPDPQPVDVGIGVAGTVTTLGMLAHGMAKYDRDAVHMLALPLAKVAADAKLLASLPVNRRSRLRGVEPRRAPVLVAGAIILECVMRHFAIDPLTVSESDILDGIALRAGAIALDEGIEELEEVFGRPSC